MDKIAELLHFFCLLEFTVVLLANIKKVAKIVRGVWHPWCQLLVSFLFIQFIFDATSVEIESFCDVKKYFVVESILLIDNFHT